jgi:hypothetical protein
MHMCVELCPEQLTRDRDRALLRARPWTSRGRGLSYAGLTAGVPWRLFDGRPDGFVFKTSRCRAKGCFDEAIQEEVRNVARTLMEGVSAKRSGRLVAAGQELRPPREK